MENIKLKMDSNISKLDNLETIINILCDEIADLAEYLESNELINGQIIDNDFYSITFNKQYVNIKIKKALTGATIRA